METNHLTERTIEQRDEHYRVTPQESGNSTEKIDERGIKRRGSSRKGSGGKECASGDAVLNKIPFCAVSEETPNVAGLSHIQTDIEDSSIVCVTDMELMHMKAITLSAVISVVTSV